MSWLDMSLYIYIVHVNRVRFTAIKRLLHACIAVQFWRDCLDA